MKVAEISAVLFALAFLCPLIGVGIGIILRRHLPNHHLSSNSTDVIKLGAGLMATLVALILGLLISSANTYRSTIQTEYKQALADIIQLDDYLWSYGQEAGGVRQHIRRVLLRTFESGGPTTTSNRRNLPLALRDVPLWIFSDRSSLFSRPMRHKSGSRPKRCRSATVSRTSG